MLDEIEIRKLLTEIRDLSIVNRHYNQIIADRSAIIMAAQDDLKAAVTRVEAAMVEAATLLKNHPDSAAVAAADQVMADAATSLHSAAAALEDVNKGIIPAPVEPKPAV